METIERIAQVAYEADRAYCMSLGDNSHLPWNTTTEAKGNAAISKAEALLDPPAHPKHPVHMAHPGRIGTAASSALHDSLFVAVINAFRGVPGAMEDPALAVPKTIKPEPIAPVVHHDLPAHVVDPVTPAAAPAVTPVVAAPVATPVPPAPAAPANTMP